MKGRIIFFSTFLMAIVVVGCVYPGYVPPPRRYPAPYYYRDRPPVILPVIPFLFFDGDYYHRRYGRGHHWHYYRHYGGHHGYRR